MSKAARTESTLAPLPFVFCFPGCAVPDTGSAYREGTFYVRGQAVGRCVSLAWRDTAGMWVTYEPKAER